MADSDRTARLPHVQAGMDALDADSKISDHIKNCGCSGCKGVRTMDQIRRPKSGNLPQGRK